jgi:hypothetical protein
MANVTHLGRGLGLLLICVLAALAISAEAGKAGVASASSGCLYSPRGCVSVQGYYKPSTGTYVSPYTRNYPGYGGYTSGGYRIGIPKISSTGRLYYSYR